MTLNRRTPLIRKTPLNRGTSELKRSPFAHRSAPLPRRREKPRKHVNDTFRASYKANFPDCELASSFPHDGKWSVIPWEGATGKRLPDVRIRRFDEPALELHHLLGGLQGNVRHDELSLVIHLSLAAHLWAERFVPDGLALGLAAKRLKGEFDQARVEQVLSCESQGLGVWLSAEKWRPRWAFVLPVWERLCRELCR